jgi:hypothetical protein
MHETRVPADLLFRLTAYFVVLMGAAVLLSRFSPDVLHSLPIDGINVFAAIGVGLSAGIGAMGVAAVMTLFFCFTNPSCGVSTMVAT